MEEDNTQYYNDEWNHCKSRQKNSNPELQWHIWSNMVEDNIMNTPIMILKEVGDIKTTETTYYPRYSKTKTYINNDKHTR